MQGKMTKTRNTRGAQILARRSGQRHYCAGSFFAFPCSFILSNSCFGIFHPADECSIIHLPKTIRSFRSKIESLVNEKADLEALEAVIANAVNRKEFDTLATQKADVSSVEEMLGAKVDRSEFDTLATQKADVSSVEEMLGAKVDRSEFDTLATRRPTCHLLRQC